MERDFIDMSPGTFGYKARLGVGEIKMGPRNAGIPKCQ